mmetsp:Transcript_33554/g.66782  ORF Transcript_33554/g.66782 Transcript_33554/m.66782 type:complete len:269 (+) Transcript_33554:884-1690(+)
MNCNSSGQHWVDSSVDPHTGLKVEGAKGGIKGPPRPCGWAVHSIGGESLPSPLCVQRPLEGCFSAFATPDEISDHLPDGFWASQGKLAAGHAEGKLHGSSHPRTAESPPLLRLIRQIGEANGTVDPPRRALSFGGEGMRDGDEVVHSDMAASYGAMEVATLKALLEPHRLPPTQQGGTANASPPRLSLIDLAKGLQPVRPQARAIFLQVPSKAAIAAQPLLQELEHFDSALVQLYGRKRFPKDMHETLIWPWHRCLKMARANKCTAVC